MSGENGLAASHILRTVNNWIKVRFDRFHSFIVIFSVVNLGKESTTRVYA